MEDRYFTENIGGVPLGILQKHFSQSLPSLAAFSLAIYLRLRNAVGWNYEAQFASGLVGRGKLIGTQEVPARVAGKWAAVAEQLVDLEFRPISYRLPANIGARDYVTALWLHSNGLTLATIDYQRLFNGTVVEIVALEFNSLGDKSPDILTGRCRGAFLYLSAMFRMGFVDLYFMPDDLPVRTVYDRHLQRISDRQVLEFSPDAAIQASLAASKRRMQWAIDVGLMRELTPSEIKRVRQKKLD